MAERGVVVTCESIRAWCEKFGQDYAKRIRARRGKPGGTRPLDEIFIKAAGRLPYLWRAVDQDGSVLDIPVLPRRDQKTAARFFKKLLRQMKFEPRVAVTDKLASYSAPCARLPPSTAYQRDVGPNNRAENSNQPAREREGRMRGFNSSRHAQQNLSAFGMIRDLYSVGGHLLSARNFRVLLRRRFDEWRTIAGVRASA